MDVLGKLIALIMVIVLIFLFPLQYLLGHQLNLFDDYVEDEVIHLVDEIRDKRYLDTQMYERFLEKLNVTGSLYDIEIERAVPKEGTEIASKEGILGVLVVSNELSSLPVISGADYLESSEIGEIFSLAAHTHTADCYVGHNHTVNNCSYHSHYGNSTSGGGCYSQANYHTHSSSCWSTGSCGGTVSASFYSSGNYYCSVHKKNDTTVAYNSRCGTCGASYGLTYGKPCLGFSAPSSYTCTQSVTKLTCTISTTVPTSYSLNCGTSEGYQCGYGGDYNALCATVVTSIAATNPTQTVDKGGGIITTVTATYLDGHTGPVSCTNNYNSSLVGVQTVTFTYSGLVGNARTTSTRTCTINVTVKETNIPSTLSVVPSPVSVYNGAEPTYTVTVTYISGATKVLESGYTKTGWTSGVGVKTVGFSYTENGKTVTTSISFTVKPNLTGITVTPAQQTIQRYTNPTFTVLATYEDSSTAVVLGFIVTGFDKNNIGIQSVTLQYTEAGITKTATTTVTVTAMKRTCPICGTVYYLDANDFDLGCPICNQTVDFIQTSPEYLTVQLGASLPVVVTATFLDGHTEAVTGWSSNYNPMVTGNQFVMITYLGKYSFINVNVKASKICSICGTNYALNDDGTNPGCPICMNFLMSLSATPSVQSVRQGDALVLTVTGLYRDGHSTVITDWSSNYNKSKAGEQQVTVYYNNQSCVVSVNVTSEDDIQCMVCGTVYNLRDNPWGCPVCIKTLTGIEAVLKTGGTRVPYGTSLDIRVVLIYQDGHREMVFDGWTDNFDPFTMGIQTVTVSYTDVFNNTVNCDLSVEVVDRMSETVCPNGHVYYADDSGSGCPYCASITGAGAEGLYTCSYTEEILDTLYTNGIYYFMAGDYISIKVSIKTDGSIFSFKLIGKKVDRAPLSYGGEVV